MLNLRRSVTKKNTNKSFCLDAFLQSNRYEKSKKNDVLDFQG
jgi:hypothetical protein